ncbi:N-acetyltransferase [Bacillus sp. HMF5848]|uniref:GNAT family N-acetyltransferase n=1 Tax=Bacillus sp. HMF5848 TaxID=2495421 RepID=UPI000F77252D|nr:GNAT family protein [Bacillus sp. HMF5848]RSK27551.1 N-acetyltransferase [Bacillus sp. HMF5848]
MKFTIIKMTEEVATVILSWTYDAPYDFYNNSMNEESMRELLNNEYYTVIDDNDLLFGFFCIGPSAQVPAGLPAGVYNEDCVDVGFGMNPLYVGQGQGFAFCSEIVTYVTGKFRGTSIRLTVATFNTRAIHLYKKLGFIKKDIFITEKAEFITMIK